VIQLATASGWSAIGHGGVGFACGVDSKNCFTEQDGAKKKQLLITQLFIHSSPEDLP
jgi:hypothetical protein